MNKKKLIKIGEVILLIWNMIEIALCFLMPETGYKGLFLMISVLAMPLSVYFIMSDFELL